MRRPDLPKRPNTTGWLWWVALLIAMVGGVVCYFIKQDVFDPSAQAKLMLTATCSAIGIGICVIAATSHFWMHR